MWNLENGLDLYDLNAEGVHQIRHFGVDLRSKFIKTVDFLQHGRVVVSGTARGEIILWDADNGTKLQALIHGAGEVYTRSVLNTALWFPKAPTLSNV